MNRNAVLLLGIMAFVAYIALRADDVVRDKARPPSASEIRKAEVVVSAERLYGDFRENELAAERRYTGRQIEVSGRVASVGRDILDSPYVALETGGLWSVQCFLLESQVERAAGLTKGMPLTVLGRCTGALMGVHIKDCMILATWAP